MVTEKQEKKIIEVCYSHSTCIKIKIHDVNSGWADYFFFTWKTYGVCVCARMRAHIGHGTCMAVRRQLLEVGSPCHSRCWACIASTVMHGTSLLVPGYPSWKHFNIFCCLVTFVIAHYEWESKRPPAEQSVWSLCSAGINTEKPQEEALPCFIFLFLYFNAFAHRTSWRI